MDVTPRVPAGRQIINAYGNSGFRVSGVAYSGSILVFPDRTEAWPVGRTEDVTVESLAAVCESGGAVELLLLGCGRSIAMVARPVQEALKACGVVVERMDTGAACRTYNVLLAEERRVAAALIAVP